MYQENATKFGTKNEILHIILYHQMTFYGYIVVDSCIILFNLNCVIQFKQFYKIATKVSSRKKVLLLLVIYLTVYSECSLELNAVGQSLPAGYLVWIHKGDTPKFLFRMNTLDPGQKGKKFDFFYPLKEEF